MSVNNLSVNNLSVNKKFNNNTDAWLIGSTLTRIPVVLGFPTLQNSLYTTKGYCFYGRLARIFHEYATNHSVAGVITEFIDIMRKDSLYPTRRLPNANLF